MLMIGGWVTSSVRVIQHRSIITVHHTAKRSITSSTHDGSIPLRTVELDLHADGAADGDPDSRVTLVMPRDWREVVRTPEDPPFWASVWPSSSALAAHILRKKNAADLEVAQTVLGHQREGSASQGKIICDLGCGLGAAGLAALQGGAKRVVFIDRNKYALECVRLAAAAGARKAAHCHTAQGEVNTVALDWHREVDAKLFVTKDEGYSGVETHQRVPGSESIQKKDSIGFDVVLGCDILAEAGVVGMEFTESVLGVGRLVKRLLVAPGGIFVLTLPTESPYRPLPDISWCTEILGREGFRLKTRILGARGAQLPGEGPEGLAPARSVAILIFENY